jgi:hypothetical protein
MFRQASQRNRSPDSSRLELHLNRGAQNDAHAVFIKTCEFNIPAAEQGTIP